MKDFELPCICGHSFKQHTIACIGCHDEHLFNDFISDGNWYESRKKAFHEFKLDNLALIEHVAKEKKLV